MNKLYENLVNTGLRFWGMILASFTGLFASQIEELNKRCKICGMEKHLADFYQHKGHKYRSSVCKSCHIKKNKLSSEIFRERNPSYNATMNKKHRINKTTLQRKYNQEKRCKPRKETLK